jgi:ABC-2 family transporter protein
VIWVAWRQQRVETLIAVAVLALLSALLVPTGIEMASRYDHDGLSACAAATSGDGCQQAIQAFAARFDPIMNLLPWLNLIPGIIGIALAAPLLLELESGTYRLAWTQSITRRRWLAVKLGIAVGAAVLAAVAISTLVTWWRAPLDHLQGRMQNVFDFEGTVGIGYVLFALGLSLAIGAVWRRTVPALIAGFAGYTVARIFVQGWLRERYEAPLTATWPVRSGFQKPELGKAWILELRPTDRLGHAIAPPLNPLRACETAGNGKGGVKLVDPSCLPRNLFNHAVYQPASRFWLFQGIETALFAGSAVALIAFAAWWLHERTA